jgi:hypothetical protein
MIRSRSQPYETEGNLKREDELFLPYRRAYIFGIFLCDSPVVSQIAVLNPSAFSHSLYGFDLLLVRALSPIHVNQAQIGAGCATTQGAILTSSISLHPG